MNETKVSGNLLSSWTISGLPWQSRLHTANARDTGLIPGQGTKIHMPAMWYDQ